MRIVNADLFIPTKEQIAMGGKSTFKVEFDNGDKADVPTDPANRHYWEVREWYFAQPKPPFVYEFDPIPGEEN